MNSALESYEIYKLLGGGSYGEVYEARSAGSIDPETNAISGRRYIAIKFLKRMNADKELEIIGSLPAMAFECENLVRYCAFHNGTFAFNRITGFGSALGIFDIYA